MLSWHLMPGLTMQRALGRVYVRVTSLTLVAYCSVQGSMSNADIHGVRTGSSGQDPQADSCAGREPMPTYAFMCERCKKSFEVVLTVAERAAPKAACPTCGGAQVTPQMAIFTAKTSRKS